MKRCCPNPNCKLSPSLIHPEKFLGPNFKPIIKKGTFYRLCDRRRIQRYLCRNCGTLFSSATHSPEYKQKKRGYHQLVRELFSSGMSQRRMAIHLDLNLKTVVRKFRIVSKGAARDHEKWLETIPPHSITEVQFDDLETFEHTRCKPISVTLMVNKKTREILGFQASQMPANGHLAKIARKKYGKRKDLRREGWESLFKQSKRILSPEVVIESDQNPHYPMFVKKHLPRASHIQHPGLRGSHTGQGEIKKGGFDPLFSLNHTCAMLRANINRLFRKTWCTTKLKDRLMDHLALYVRYHNTVLLG
jgi:hypothetical protein